MKQRKLIISHEERGQRSQSGRQRVPTRYTSGPTTAGTRRRDRRNRELLPTKGQEKQNGSYQATLNDRSLLSTSTRTRGQRLGKKNRYSHYTHYQRRAQTGPAAGNRFLVHRDLAFLQITPAGLTTNNTNLDINMFRLRFIITSIISTLLINNIFFTATFTTINITICNNFHITTNNMINTFIINITNIINITVMTVTTGLAQPPYLRTRQDQKQDAELRPE